MKKFNLIAYVILIMLLGACAAQTGENAYEIDVESVLNNSLKQYDNLVQEAYNNDKIPRTIDENGDIHWTNDEFDWTEGFFPGTLWYIYAATNNEKYKKAAEYFQEKFIEHRFLTHNHDLGFVFNNSFGIGYRLSKDESYKQVLIEAGNSLIVRFNPAVGAIQSWDTDSGWQQKRGWKFPVIIDNMMNLEMLFALSELTGDEKYKEVAIKHANTTLKNHFRDDYSSFHVVDYDPETGNVRQRQTAQGYAHESSWARGQAWGLYGYTMCYRYAKDSKYLDIAEKIARFYLNHPNLPSDLVPYWDFDAPKIPNEPRDVSAAAIVASALIELDRYSDQDYLSPAIQILKNLSSDKYTAEYGTNKNFLLKHSVGSIPHDNEIDVPLNYADYYYIEALLRIGKTSITSDQY